MKKEFNIINTYIKTVSKDIKDRKVKKELKDELFSHLIEIYERNIALGLSDEDAQKNAVAHMGDSEAVAKTFKKLYPVSSADYFKGAAWSLVYPLIMVFAFIYRKIDFLYLFTFGLFISLLRIRKVNKLFNIAFFITIINAIIQTISALLQCYYILDRRIVMGFMSANYIAIIAIYILVICGLLKIKKQLNEPKTDFILALVSIPLVIISNILIIVEQFTGFGTLYIVASAVNILPALVIYTTVKDIDRLDIKISYKKNTLLVVVSLFLALFLATMGIYLVGNLKVYEPTEYMIDDVQTNVSEIKSNLIELGLPEHIANELPESEILKYQGANKLDVYEDKNESFNPFAENDEEIEEDLSKPHYIVYTFTLTQPDTEIHKVRTLVAIDRFEEFDESYYTEFFVDYYRSNSSDVFCKMLCNVDGVTKEIVPIHNQAITDDDIKRLHYVFTPTKNAQNHRGYIAQTITSTTDDAQIGFNHEFAQSLLYEINNPFEEYWRRTFGYDEFNMYIDNPIYIEPEEPEDTTTNEVLPWLDGSIGFEPSEEIYDIDELIEYYNP